MKKTGEQEKKKNESEAKDDKMPVAAPIVFQSQPAGREVLH
jgi:hypothetical protein